MTLEPTRKANEPEAVRESLEPSDAWMGFDLDDAPPTTSRPAAQEKPRALVQSVRRPAARKGSYKNVAWLAAALTIGAAGVWAMQGDGSNVPEPGSEAADVELAAAPPEDEDEKVKEVEAKRDELLVEIERLKTLHASQKSSITELDGRRSSLSEELSELERQRQEWLKQIGDLQAKSAARAKSVEGSRSIANGSENAAKAVEEPPAENDEADAQAAAEVARIEEERRAKIAQEEKIKAEQKAKEEAVLALQRKQEEAQKRVRELQEKKAAAERALARKRERDGIARLQEQARGTPAAPDVDSTWSLQARLYRSSEEQGGPVAGYDRRDQRSALLPPPPPRLAPPPAPQAATGGDRKRVYVHFSAADPGGRDKAHVVAEKLQSRGFEVVELRAVRGRFRGNAVRYFHNQDRGAAPSLSGAVSRTLNKGASVQDFRNYGRAPKEGTLEVWVGE